MPEHATPSDFIEVYPDALDHSTCVALVQRFLTSGQGEAGRVGSGVMPELKDSRDLTITGLPDWSDAEATLNMAVQKAVAAYLRRYPHLLIAP